MSAGLDPVIYDGEGKRLLLLDQRALPNEVTYVSCRTSGEVAAAITDMVVRGAPAIDVSAAFGVSLGARNLAQGGGTSLKIASFMAGLTEACSHMKKARPTAVNLMWAVDRMYGVADALAAKGVRADEIASGLENEAKAMFQEDVEANERISRYGAALLPESGTVLTHCNAGARGSRPLSCTPMISRSASYAIIWPGTSWPRAWWTAWPRRTHTVPSCTRWPSV